jgi:hypothetical protein
MSTDFFEASEELPWSALNKMRRRLAWLPLESRPIANIDTERSLGLVDGIAEADELTLARMPSPHAPRLCCPLRDRHDAHSDKNQQRERRV